MTSKIKIAVVSSAILALLGGIAAVLISFKNKSSLKVGLGENLTFNYEIDKVLNPGESVSHDFVIKYNNYKSINYSLWFKHKALPENYYLQFKLIINDEVYKEDKCNIYIETNKLFIPLDIEKDIKGTLTFYIPSSVGNETQNVSYDFITNMKVEKR